MKKNKKYIPAVVGFSAMSLAVVAAQKAETPPNIIFILADDMGYGDLSSYGNKVIQTPNIDKLAEEGIRFTQAYAGSAVSSPSRAALLTGKHTGNTTIRDNFAKKGGLPGLKNGNPIRRMHLLPQDTTIATILSAVGYKTCIVNKWHLDGFNPGAGPLDRGFHEFYGWLVSYETSNTPYYYPETRFYNRELKVISENENNARGIHGNDLSVNESIDFIERNKTHPFFLYLAFDSPHEPYFINSVEPYASMPLSDTAKLYAALITHTDKAIGMLIDSLYKNNLRENMLINFTSYNGGAAQAPLDELNCNAGLRGRKALLYEGGIKVPFIVNFPKKIKANQTKENLIYFPDVMPTLAELTGSKTPINIDGISILPLLKGEKMNTDNRILYWEFPNQQVAIRKGKWKAVSVKKNADLELYDMEKDPFEKNNLAQQYPKIVDELKSEIDKSRTVSLYYE
ncbi:MAG: sulfatase-like hydrolase/transferase [Porphyromonadaceae bacterium]|nr:sulfatase-like hydrolase/transferase [Porphyromonadaceae bacterium]